MIVWLVMQGTFHEGAHVWSIWDTEEAAVLERDALTKTIPGSWRWNGVENRWETMSDYLCIDIDEVQHHCRARAAENAKMLLAQLALHNISSCTFTGVARPSPEHDGRVLLVWENEESRMSLIAWDDEDTYSWCYTNNDGEETSGHRVPLSMALSAALWMSTQHSIDHANGVQHA